MSTKRRFSWIDAALKHDRHWHVRLCIFIALGMAEGIYKGYEQVPLWSSLSEEERKQYFGLGGEEDGEDNDDDCLPALADCDEDDGAAKSLVDEVRAWGVTADVEKGPTKSGAEFLKAMRKKCSNTMG